MGRLGGEHGKSVAALLALCGDGRQHQFIGAEEGVLQPQLSRERAQALVPRAATCSMSGHWDPGAPVKERSAAGLGFP